MASSSYRDGFGALVESLYHAQSVLEAAEEWVDMFVSLHDKVLTPETDPIHRLWLHDRDEKERNLVKAVEAWRLG